MAENTRQGAGIIHLGTPTNPTLYTARVLQGPSEWQRVALAFIASEPLLRISLLGQAAGPGNTVEYDGIRFLPPGRNPVLLMAAIFARFLPHLTLDAASVTAAAERRNAWLFSGYIPDPGRTDQLLTRMSQECFCTVFKDLDGLYKITADDPDDPPVLHLESQYDLLQDTLALEGVPMEQVYTDFYLWYQRVTTQVTTSQAGQYAAVLYATPDTSISQYSELQTLCQQAADTYNTRTRFDFYSDFIADPATADLLLARFVRQYSVMRHDVMLQATLPALPLSLTDHVAVHAPLLGPQPFVGELRRSELAVSAQAPGLAMALTLRESGLVRGVWEAWDVGALAGGPESWPPGTPRVRETWPAPAGGPWYPQSDFAAQTPPVGCLYALRGFSNPLGIGGEHQIAAAGGGPLPGPLSLEAQSPVWRFTDANVATGLWEPGLVFTTAMGRGTALGIVNAGGTSPLVFVAFERQSGTSEVWQLRVSGEEAEFQAVILPDGTQVWAMAEHNFSDGNGNGLYMGTANGLLYRWNLVDTTTLRLNVGSSTRRFRALATHPVTGEFWAAVDNTSFTSTGNVVMYQLTALGSNSTVPGGGGNRQTCNMVAFDGQLWAAFGVEDRSEISLWSLADTLPWVKRSTVTGLTDQLPGCLGAFDGTLWLGSLSSTGAGTPQIWRSDTAGLVWTLDTDFATTAAGDPNPSVTAMAVARGRLYVATGMPYGASAPGARVYCRPLAEGITP